MQGLNAIITENWIYKFCLLILPVSLLVGIGIVYSIELLALLAGVIIAAILLSLSPRILLYSLIISSFVIGYAAEIKLTQSVSGLWVIGGMVPLLLIANLIVKKFPIKNLCLEHKIYFIFLIYSFAAFFFPEGGELSARVSVWAKIFNGFLLFYLGSYFFLSPTEQKKLPFLLMVALIPVIVISLPTIISGGLETHRWVDGQRVDVQMVSGGFYSARYLAFSLVVIQPALLLGIAYWEGKKERSFFSIFLIISISLLYLTYRRTMWAGALLIFLIWLLYYLKNSLTKRSSIVFFLLLLCGGIIFTDWFVNNIVIHFYDTILLILNIQDALNSPNLDYVWTGRWGFFRSAYIATIIDQPIYYTLFGRGIGSTAPILQQAGFAQTGGHSNYFVLLMDFGIIGFALYFGLILGILKKSFYILKNTHVKFHRLYALSSISLISAYLLMSLAEHLIWHLVQFNWLFWILLAPIVSIGFDKHNTKK